MFKFPRIGRGAGSVASESARSMSSKYYGYNINVLLQKMCKQIVGGRVHDLELPHTRSGCAGPDV